MLLYYCQKMMLFGNQWFGRLYFICTRQQHTRTAYQIRFLFARLNAQLLLLGNLAYDNHIDAWFP